MQCGSCRRHPILSRLQSKTCMSGDADAIQRRYSASFWRYTDAMMLLRVGSWPKPGLIPTPSPLSVVSSPRHAILPSLRNFNVVNRPCLAPGNDSHKRPLHHLLNSQRLIHCYDCSHRRQPSKPWIYAANKLQQIVGPDTTIGLTPTLDSTLRQKPANI